MNDEVKKTDAAAQAPHASPERAAAVDACADCNAPMSAGQAFCSNCGASNASPTKSACAKCGAPLAQDQVYCSMCGHKRGADTPGAPVSPDARSARAKPKLSPVHIGAAAVALVAIVIVLVAIGSSGLNFKKMAAKLDISSRYYTIASDGSSLSLDTNPLNLDDHYDAAGVQAIKDMNKALKLPDSLWTEMSQTRALDGRQSQSFAKVTVSWSYHPDNGLEVLYKKK